VKHARVRYNLIEDNPYEKDDFGCYDAE